MQVLVCESSGRLELMAMFFVVVVVVRGGSCRVDLGGLGRKQLIL